MCKEGSDWMVPAATLPVPLAGYRLEDEAIVLTTVNNAFTRTFGTPPHRLQAWWNDREITSPETTVEEFKQTLQAGQSTTVEVRIKTVDSAPELCPRQLAAHHKNNTDGIDGYLTVTASATSYEDTVEVNWIASVISHDLRNPLDVAKARLQAARETGDEEHFDHLERAHDRMERIIADVLTLARGENAITSAESVALAQVATDAWNTVDTKAATMEMEENLPSVMADPDRLQRLFENLFRNSIEHGQTDNKESLTVQIGTTDHGFYIADTGKGIPEAVRERIFEPGYTQSGGTGFGLTIVERIADAHGWTVVATGDDGARFEFENVECK